MTATLRFEAREASSAGAQGAVNRAMAAALETARAAPGVTASTGSYRTGRQEDTSRWVASQALSLRAAGQEALLELVGALQSRGLALEGLNHGLTRDARRTARQEAAALAVDALRRRADVLAAGIGMRVERIAEINLDTPDSPPMRLAMAPASRAAPAPVSQAEDIVVGASASAVVVLLPN